MSRKGFIICTLLLLITNIITLNNLLKVKFDLEFKEEIIEEIYSGNQKGKESNPGSYIIIYKTENMGLPIEGWERYFEKHPNQNKNYIGKSKEEIKELFGEPYLIIKHTDITREFWCYMPNVNSKDLNNVDNTGISWYFEDNAVIDIKIDDFNGIIEEKVELYLEW